jgi:CarD family transcriptional regulator
MRVSGAATALTTSRLRKVEQGYNKNLGLAPEPSPGLKMKDNNMAAAAKSLKFGVGDYVVYPKHGVGRVIDVETQEIAGASLDLYVIRFEKERMTLRVPTNKIESAGMRKLSSSATMQEALATLKGKPKVKRTMWSRRAQEYEAKINSGDLVSIAEVVRDLFRAEDQPEQSFSERQIYEAAVGRLARELAAMENSDEQAAQEKIEKVLSTGVRATAAAVAAAATAAAANASA